MPPAEAADVVVAALAAAVAALAAFVVVAFVVVAVAVVVLAVLVAAAVVEEVAAVAAAIEPAVQTVVVDERLALVVWGVERLQQHCGLGFAIDLPRTLQLDSCPVLPQC